MEQIRIHAIPVIGGTFENMLQSSPVISVCIVILAVLIARQLIMGLFR